MGQTIYWVSDSTVQDNDYTTYPQCGMGQGLRLFLQAGTVLENHAKNGRSTKSFMDEGRFEVVKSKMRRGDLLLIQFAHNDEKSEDPSRYTEAFGAYQDNLRMMVQAANEAGAYPVLITSVSRCKFDEAGQLKDKIHGDYPEAMKAVASEVDVPLIDLYETSRDILSQLGPKESLRYFMVYPKGAYDQLPDGSNDTTHLNMEGAVTFAKVVAEGLKVLGGHYAASLIDWQ